MERCTKSGFDFETTNLTEGLTDSIGSALNRLAAYEDTDIPPENVPTFVELVSAVGVHFALKEYQELGSVDHLRELVQAEKQGLLVRLPCKVGDNAYFILPDANGYLGYFVSEAHRITEVGTRGFWISELPDDKPNAMHDFTQWDEMGKTVFLTREEAEAALLGGEENG